MAIAYGFAELTDDGFKQLANSQQVGTPLHNARYLGDSLAYQFTDTGSMWAVKDDGGNWICSFTPKA